MKLTHFEQLEAWQQPRKLAKAIYQFVKKQNFSKDFRLVNQTTKNKCQMLRPDPLISYECKNILLALKRENVKYREIQS